MKPSSPEGGRSQAQMQWDLRGARRLDKQSPFCKAVRNPRLKMVDAIFSYSETIKLHSCDVNRLLRVQES